MFTSVWEEEGILLHQTLFEQVMKAEDTGNFVPAQIKLFRQQPKFLILIVIFLVVPLFNINSSTILPKELVYFLWHLLVKHFLCTI